MQSRRNSSKFRFPRLGDDKASSFGTGAATGAVLLAEPSSMSGVAWTTLASFRWPA
jgi:hypothetical protein